MGEAMMVFRAPPIRLLLLGLAAAGPGQAQDLHAAEAFLRGVYAPYEAKGEPVDLTGPAAESILTPSLATLLRDDAQAVDGEVGVLEADPICACQDFDIRNVVVSVEADGAGRAKATVKFKNLGHPTQIRFDLATLQGAWRIADIHEDNLPSLRKVLEDEIKGVAAERAKQPH
jgi:hypothetical protein